jgi:hypothetical protein
MSKVRDLLTGRAAHGIVGRTRKIGEWGIGGKALTTEAVKALAAGK